ncbi:MAG: DUF1353 domain-containing protein [Chthoniobacter sp.]|uniref:DUF1353 domain-containing protein n=1 Tax=Chthoniobacter sp. TaxID=2510640 RepID=UPI0032A6F23D
MKTRTLLPATGLGLLLLAGCSTQATFDKVPQTGRFSGEPRMVAMAPDTFFFFQPKKDPPFAFTTHRKDEAVPANGGRGQYRLADWKIQPEDIITDGASVPRQLWNVTGFSAFDFTRAALIHDWLYEAHHRYVMAGAAYEAAKLRGNTQAMQRSAEDRRHYEPYKDITQDDAADIFAECVKSAMLESEEIVKEFDLQKKNRSGAAPPESANLTSLKDAFHTNRPSALTLWAYHYFVSSDCLVGASKQAWEERSTDVDIYRVLASKKVAAQAEKNGYLSKWMIHRFRDILKREEERHHDYQQALQQGIAAQTTPAFPPVKKNN